MIRHKLAIGGVTAGLLLGGWSMIGVGSDATAPPPVAAAATSAAAIDQPVQTQTPIDEIVELWQRRADEHPLDYLSRTQLGNALSQRGREQADLDDHERAEAAHLEALALNPRHQPAQLGLASALLAQHRFVEARDIVAGAVEAAGRDQSLSALALLGDAHLELGDYDQASDAYRALADHELGAPALSRLARLAAVQTTPQEAVRLAEDALADSEGTGLRPNQAAFYWFQVGHYRFLAGDESGAVTALETALEIEPGHPAANEKLAYVLASIGERERAAALYQQLLATGPAPDLHGLYADLLTASGDLAAAARQEQLGRELADETRDRYPAERRHLIEFYLTRDPALAVELAQLDLADRQDIGAHDALAWALFHAGRIDEAARAIEPALAEGTIDASLRYHAAAIAAANGDVHGARRQLEVALELNPNFHPTEAHAAAELADDLARR